MSEFLRELRIVSGESDVLALGVPEIGIKAIHTPTEALVEATVIGAHDFPWGCMIAE